DILREGLVEEIEEPEAELKDFRLCDFEILEQREVPVLSAWRAEVEGRDRWPRRAKGRNVDGAHVENFLANILSPQLRVPAIDRRNRPRKSSIGRESVRTESRKSQSRHIAGEPQINRSSTGQGGDARNLPAVQQPAPDHVLTRRQIRQVVVVREIEDVRP